MLSPRITVPIPDAAESVPGLKNLYGHSHAAQAVKEIATGKSRADDDDVEFFCIGVVRSFRLDRTHKLTFL